MLYKYDIKKLKKASYLCGCTAVICALSLSGCLTRNRPAPVLDLGLNSDSKTGAIIIKEGDTLWNISKKFRIPLRAIIDTNNISPPYDLSLGQRLKIPAPVDYKVRAHDTLYSISNMFDVSVYELVRNNSIGKPYVINVGQYLRIPSKYDKRHKVVVSKDAPPAKAVPVKEVEKVATTKRPNGLLKTQNGEEVAKPVRPTNRRPANIKVAGNKKVKFSWPAKGKIISTYGAKKNGLYNDGINIALPKNAPIIASADGVVAYVGGDLRSYGNLVLVKHSGGITTAYAHLDNISVRKGEKISKGQLIGAAGSTGNVSTSQLHFEIRKGSKTYNPERYL